MKRRTRRLIVLGILSALVLIILTAILSGKKTPPQRRRVTAEIRDIEDKALAVGSIEPLNEIAVKSKISGVVGKLFADVGDFIEQGAPLLEVKPDPTPLERIEAKRNVEMRRIALNTLKKELIRNDELLQKGLISEYEYEQLRRIHDEAALHLQIAEEQLDLLEKGRVELAGQNIETVIKSPITGFILEKAVNVGDPVVPLTSYQAGTELMKIADMKQLIFKGTVDEIDVGRIREGMKAELQIGALPGAAVDGHVSLISLKARKRDNTTVFPVEIIIDEMGNAVLRAGYSANAHIIIERKSGVLTIPERVITFRNDSAFVMLPALENGSVEIHVETGLSDAIHIEIISGLEQGQEVLEKEVQEIL